jgi:hypothetical protein
MHQDHFVYRPDSTKVGKMIAMFLGGKLLGPDWSRYAVHHYAISNNAVEGVSRIQLQSEHATSLQGKQVYLQVIEPGGNLSFASAIDLEVYLNDHEDRKVWSRRLTWGEFDPDDIIELWVWLRLCGQDGQLVSPAEYLIHPDNRC